MGKSQPQSCKTKAKSQKRAKYLKSVKQGNGKSAATKGGFGPVLEIKGRRGVLVTCSPSCHKTAVTEAVDLLTEISNNLWPSSSNEDNTSNVDTTNFESMLRAEIDDLKSDYQNRFTGGSGGKGRLINVNTLIPGNIFIRIEDPSICPYRLVSSVMDHIETLDVTARRLCYKIVPVDMSVSADLESIKRAASTVLEKRLSLFSDSKTKTFAVVLNRRYTSLDRNEIISVVADVFPPNRFTVDLKNPDIVMLVEVFRNICLLALVDDFYSKKKYNLMSLSGEANKTNAVSIEQ